MSAVEQRDRSKEDRTSGWDESGMEASSFLDVPKVEEVNEDE
jgi:hypothetical protein